MSGNPESSFSSTVSDCKKMVSVKLLFFARAREIVGMQETQITMPPGPYTSHSLLEEVVNHFDELKSIAASVMLALNEEYIDNSIDFYLKDGDHLAIIPPLSGG